MTRLIWLLNLIIGIVSLVLIVNVYAVDMDIIAEIESGGIATAYNKWGGGCYGKYQVSKSVLQEYNEFTQNNLDIQDMFVPNLCYQVSSWYMNFRIPQLIKHFELPNELETQLICYNAGIVSAIQYYYHGKKLPVTTVNYINKYHRLLDKEKGR